MATVPDDYRLTGDQHETPVLWVVDTKRPVDGTDCSDEAMERYLGGGRSMRLKSFGHDESGVHFLLTRAGTTVHTDRAYTRYSHQLVLRNDGNRIRGLPRYDPPQNQWHPPLRPGVLYCLDTHSPHQGIHDPRIGPRAGLKAVIAVDRDTPLRPAEAYALLSTWIGRQFGDVDYDPTAVHAPRWKSA